MNSWPFAKDVNLAFSSCALTFRKYFFNPRICYSPTTITDFGISGKGSSQILFVDGLAPDCSTIHLRLLFKNGPIPASFLFIFVLFLLQFQYKLKKRRWCAWDSNPGPQDGRRRRNHGAMAATIHLRLLGQIKIVISRFIQLYWNIQYHT